MPAIARTYQRAASNPIFLVGHCPNCQSGAWLNTALPYTSNEGVECEACGRTHPKREWIQQVLVNVDVIAWGLLASDVVIWDRVEMNVDDWATYETGQENVAKWLDASALPRLGSGRYVAVVNAWGDFVMVSVNEAHPQSPAVPHTPINVQWYRFGLTSLGAVPAWRQSMFAAALMIESNPAAAAVLIAAGFEAFFIETMRINWKERGFKAGAFAKIRKQPVSALIDWLPGAVDMESLSDGPDNLQGQWKNQVNELRNTVVHKANVHVKTEEARNSLDCALRCVTHIDPLGLVRPHSYFAGESRQPR